MSKLHELLAVEDNLSKQAVSVVSDLTGTFEKKRHLFEEKRVTFIPNTEGAQPVTEQQSDINSTVSKELDWISEKLTKALDAQYHISEANTQARADVILDDGSILLKNLPATALLELEKRVAEIMVLLKAIPTLDPAKGFKPDPSRPGGIYEARPVSKQRTKKSKKVYVLHPGSTEHPAQTQLVDEDIPVGTIQEQEWSGLISPAEKSALIDRVEETARAVRRARSKANEQELDTKNKIGSSLIHYVFYGKK